MRLLLLHPTTGDCKLWTNSADKLQVIPRNLCSGHFKVILGQLLCLMQNNSDKSSQGAMVIFMAEPRKEKSKNTRGCLVFFESATIKWTTLSATAAELYALLKCYETCQMLRGLIKDITGLEVRFAGGLMPTILWLLPLLFVHMITKLCKEACSGSIADLSRNYWNSMVFGWLFDEEVC